MSETTPPDDTTESLRERIARALAPSGWLRDDGLQATVDAVLAALAVPESNQDAEVCGDERPREFGDTRVITCTLPRGHASHRAAKYGSAWEYLRVDYDLATTPLDAPHSPAEPVSPVSTPTEAHGETGEAQEG